MRIRPYVKVATDQEVSAYAKRRYNNYSPGRLHNAASLTIITNRIQREYHYQRDTYAGTRRIIIVIRKASCETTAGRRARARSIFRSK